MNRRHIRKLILQEFHKRILKEQEEGVEVIPTFASEEAKQSYLSELNALVEMLQGDVVNISEEEAADFAERIYEATKGGFLDLGIGTSEGKIEDVLKEIPTIVDISYVSAKFEKLYDSAWTFTPTLSAVFSSELDGTDMEKYVNTIINDKMKNKFIKIGSLEPMGKEAFFEIVGAGEAIRSQFVGEKTSGWVASSGVLSAFDAINDDDPKTDYFVMPAVTDAGGTGAAAAIAASGGNPISAARGGGAAIKQAVVSARASAGREGSTALYRAHGLSQAGIRAAETDAAKAAARKAATKTAKRAGRKAALRAGGMTLLKQTPKLAARAIPFVGWALLAVELADWAMSADISENTDLALDSTLYKRLQDFLKQGVGNIESEIDALQGVPVTPVEEDEEGEGKDYPDLGWGLERSFIENIVKTMNAYDETRGGIEGYVKSTPAQAWNPQIQESWSKFAPHALLNCSIYEFHKDKAEDAESWLALSAAMKSDFPGYTPNPRGCLAFCLDAYYDDVRFGKGGTSSGGGGTPAPSPGDVDPNPDSKPQKGGGKITIESTGGSDRVPLSVPFNNATEAALIRSIEDQFSENARRTAIKAASLEFDIILKKDGSIRRVKRKKPMGGAERDNFKGNLQNTVEDALEGRMQIFNKKENPEKKKYLTPEGNLRIVIVIPGGYRIR